MIALAGSPLTLDPFRSTAEEVERTLRDLIARLPMDITAATRPHVRTPAERDPELERALLELDADLGRSSRFTSGVERDAWWEQVESDAAPYALAFYYEICRLDDLRLWSTSRPPDIHKRSAQ